MDSNAGGRPGSPRCLLDGRSPGAGPTGSNAKFLIAALVEAHARQIVDGIVSMPLGQCPRVPFVRSEELLKRVFRGPASRDDLNKKAWDARQVLGHDAIETMADGGGYRLNLTVVDADLIRVAVALGAYNSALEHEERLHRAFLIVDESRGADAGLSWWVSRRNAPAALRDAYRQWTDRLADAERTARRNAAFPLARKPLGPVVLGDANPNSRAAFGSPTRVTASSAS
jgi:hypothetical protein